jgi:hypothetical protein
MLAHDCLLYESGLSCNADLTIDVLADMKGIAALALLVVTLSACGTVGVGTNAAASPSPGVSAATTPTPSPDPTANWVSFQSSAGQFSLKHPPSWFVSPEGDNNGFVSVGMGKQHPYGGSGEYVTDISAGSWPVAMQMDTSCFKLAAGQSEPEAVDGVTGVRKTGTLIACQGGQTLDTVEYDFTTAGRYYLFSYTKLTDGVPLSDFDLMVRSTATFSG